MPRSEKPSAVPIAIPATSPIAQPVRQCRVALIATPVSARPLGRHLVVAGGVCGVSFHFGLLQSPSEVLAGAHHSIPPRGIRQTPDRMRAVPSGTCRSLGAGSGCELSTTALIAGTRTAFARAPETRRRRSHLLGASPPGRDLRHGLVLGRGGGALEAPGIDADERPGGEPVCEDAGQHGHGHRREHDLEPGQLRLLLDDDQGEDDRGESARAEPGEEGDRARAAGRCRASRSPPAASGSRSG